LAGFAEIEARSQGAETLVPLVRDIFARAGLEPRFLRRIAAVRGPGGFTGLRLGPVSAAGLAKACGALQAGMDYLPLLAQSAVRRLAPELSNLRDPDGIRLWVLVHARRNLVYAQSFIFPTAEEAAREAGNAVSAESAGSGGSIGVAGSEGAVFSGRGTVADGMLVCPPAQLAALIRAAGFAGPGTRPLLLGSGLEKNREEFSRLLDGGGEKAALPLPPEYARPAPETLLAVAASLEYGAADIEPFYARPSDAEENLALVAASLGIDPGAARVKLTDIAAGRR
jgi:tRNA threonylcarbamoyl adenosine modification protein YeaZ